MYKNLRAHTRYESVHAHNTKPEVDIMRNGNKTRQLLSLARIFVLALCFTLVFAFALSKNNSQVASAYTVEELEKDGDATLGSPSSFFGDNSELTGTHFGYPGLSADTQTWTFTETYNTVVPSTGNHQIFKLKGNTTMYTHVGDANHWLWGVKNGMAAAEVHGAMNFNLSGFVAQMIQNDNVTVKAKVTANIGAKDVNNLFYSAVAVPAGKELTGGLSYDLRNNKSESGQDKTGFIAGYQNSDKKGAQDRTSNEVTLTKETPGLGFALGCGWGQQVVSHDHHVYMSNIRVTYTITFNNVTDSSSLNIGDNAAPVASSTYGIQNSYQQGTSGSGYAPYLTDAKNAPVYYDSIKNNVKLDSIVDGAGKMQSYTNASLGQISADGANHSYYKFAQTEYVDMYNYSGESSIQSAILKYGADAAKTIGVGDRLITGISSDGTLQTSETNNSTHLQYASGIKTVTVNETTFNIWDATDRAKTKAITVENDDGVTVVVGYAKVNYINRGRVAVMIYMIANGTVQTSVGDYGGISSKSRIEFSGIDTTSPDDSVNGGTNVSLDNYIKSSSSNLAWFRQNKIVADGSINVNEDDTAAGYSPYLWFYTVNRADSLADLNGIAVTQFADYNAVKAAGINPIALGEISSFTYDFANGVAKAYGGGEQGNPTSITDNVTGHGYYRFTFYIFDLAGNKGGVKSFYTKVDYDRPEYTVDYSFDKNGVQTTILASENGKWATGDVTLKFTLTAGGFSGYTFRFEDANGAMHAIVVNGMGDYEGDSYVAGIANYITSASGTATTAVSNDITININGVDVNVAYAVEGGNGTFTFTIPAPATAFFEWISTFSMFCGQYASINAIDIDEQSVEYINNDWKGGIKVLIDGIAPTVPLFEDEEGYLSTFENYELPSSRNWFTTSYNLPVMLAFNDAITATDYASGLKIHYGIKAVKNLTELLAYRDINVENNYKSAIDIQKELGFDRYIMVTGDALDGDATDFTLQLLQNLNAGMRLVYVWAEDQAGNVSELSRYFVLVDANNYSVSASVKSNAKLESGFANLTFTNAEGVAVTTIKRGETLLFNVGLANSYVPFKFTQNGNVLFENYTQNQVWSGISNENAQYITASGYETLRVTLDDFNNLTDLEKSNKFELSARKVVTYNYINSSVGYTAAPTDVSSVVISGYEGAKSSFVYRFVDSDNNLLYENNEGGTTTDPSEAKLDSDGSPVFFVPTKVGSYRVRIYIPKDDESFVTSDFETNDAGEQVFAPVRYDVIKGKAVITVKSSTSKFGEPASSVLGMLDFDVTGIDKAQMASENIFVNLVLKDVTLASGETYRVGNYAIVNQSSDYSAATNYDVTFNSAIHTVTRRQVTIDAWSASKAFGDSDPEFRFGVELAQFAGLYKSANEIVADVFSAYKPVTDTTADGYALFYAGGSISRESAEGVGQYDFASDASLFDIDSNYSIVVQTTKYKFTIEKRIVKLDVSGQSSVFPFGTTVESEISKIAPTYKIAAKDMVVASQIEALFANGAQLSLGAQIAELTDENYSAAYKYAILLGGNLDDGNVVIELDASGAEYIVYVTKQNAIVVKVKDGVNFEFVYGFVWSENTLVFDSEKFELQGTPSGEYTSVKWSVDEIGRAHV